ncbi:MAG: ribbon-helix-helix protein, CopG family [Deltaproteobacteria bacterium]|nr:ribbon-helix-helix protein, CopG family [Deltaproteobacteria bacterium]
MNRHPIVTVSLPREMLKKLEAARQVEHRSRSALVREALQLYFTTSPTAPSYTPTPAELRTIERGRRAIARGEYLTLDELHQSMATHHCSVCRVKSAPVTSP